MVIRPAFWAAVTLMLALGACSRAAPMTCATAGSGKAVAVLVIGDSWASKGRLDLALADHLARRFGAARACSIGLSGETASEVAHDLPAIHDHFDQAILLVGVNDVVNHTGAANYAAGVRRLMTETRAFAPDVEVVTIPRVNAINPPVAFHRGLKHWLWREAIDHGQADVTDRYRQALGPVKAIPFDDFIPSYAGHESLYMPDEIHLRDFAALGAFIGDRVEITAHLRPATSSSSR